MPVNGSVGIVGAIVLVGVGVRSKQGVTNALITTKSVVLPTFSSLMGGSQSMITAPPDTAASYS